MSVIIGVDIFVVFIVDADAVIFVVCVCSFLLFSRSVASLLLLLLILLCDSAVLVVVIVLPTW